MNTKRYTRTPETKAADTKRLAVQRKFYIKQVLTNLERLQQTYEKGDTWWAILDTQAEQLNDLLDELDED